MSATASNTMDTDEQLTTGDLSPVPRACRRAAPLLQATYWTSVGEKRTPRSRALHRSTPASSTGHDQRREHVDTWRGNPRCVPDESFDSVVSFSVLEHLRARVGSRDVPVLRSGGTVLLQVVVWGIQKHPRFLPLYAVGSVTF